MRSLSSLELTLKPCPSTLSLPWRSLHTAFFMWFLRSEGKGGYSILKRLTPCSSFGSTIWGAWALISWCLSTLPAASESLFRMAFVLLAAFFTLYPMLQVARIGWTSLPNIFLRKSDSLSATIFSCRSCLMPATIASVISVTHRLQYHKISQGLTIVPSPVIYALRHMYISSSWSQPQSFKLLQLYRLHLAQRALSQIELWAMIKTILCQTKMCDR